jgi:tetratricopeptide (TPR) repeat protein
VVKCRVVIALCVVFVVMTGAYGQSDSETVERAAAAYQTGDYVTAITLYEELITQGIETAQVYINLAHAYYQDGQLGFALLNYRRAERLEPRNGSADEYIARIRGERVDYQRDAQNWLDRLAGSTRSVMTLRELQEVTGVLWAIFFSLTICWLWVKHWRNRLLPVLVVVGIFVMVAIGALATRSYVSENRPAAVIVELSEQVMSGPGESYLPLYTLYTAAEMRILERQDDWVRFVLPDRREGWLPADAIRVV